MTGYRLTPSASEDLEEIENYYLEYASAEVAMRMEDQFFEAFVQLAESPGLGHRREDLLPGPFHFFTIDPYFIVYRRNISPIIILGVVHSARNLKRILRKRTRIPN